MSNQQHNYLYEYKLIIKFFKVQNLLNRDLRRSLQHFLIYLKLIVIVENQNMCNHCGCQKVIDSDIF